MAAATAVETGLKTATAISPPPRSPSRPPDQLAYVATLVIGTLAVALLGGLVVKFGKPVDASQAAASAGVLALATALSIGIERVLEGFWTLVDRLASKPKWPFSNDAALIERFVQNFSSYVKAPLEQTDAWLKSGATIANELVQEQPQVSQQVSDLLQSVDSILAGQQDPTKWSSLRGVQSALLDLNEVIGNRGAGADLALAASTVDTLSGIADSLLTNPGRKLMSLFAGAVIALGVVWLLGLDLVHAALQVAPSSSWQWGMAITGVVVGLGSNPTHELIKAIQAYKQSR